MGKKLVVSLAGVGALAAGFVAFGSGATPASSAALSCPSALADACGPVDLVISTACYQPLPSLPTVGPLTLKVDGRAVYCPDL